MLSLIMYNLFWYFYYCLNIDIARSADIHYYTACLQSYNNNSDSWNQCHNFIKTQPYFVSDIYQNSILSKILKKNVSVRNYFLTISIAMHLVPGKFPTVSIWQINYPYYAMRLNVVRIFRLIYDYKSTIRTYQVFIDVSI